jgi:2-hydroxychromene-2-carboxylate isomerase
VARPDPLFYLGAMSPYSWLAAERIDALLPDAQWRPVFLAAVFKASDRTSWGLTERREVEIAQCEARAAAHGLGPIHWPEPWPTSDLLVARGMAYADSRGVLRQFALSAMRVCFLDGRDLAELDSVLEAGRRTGIEPSVLERALGDDAVKGSLRHTTDEAIARGVVGVPTVAIGTDLFWGDDRLEDAAAAYSALPQGS